MVLNPLLICHVATFFIGASEVALLNAPVGVCDHCCPVNDKYDIRFQLFTRSNPRTFQLLQIGNKASLRRSNFNTSNPTVIYLMGFTETTTGISTVTMRDAHLATGEYNFIAVDWTRLIAFPWYLEAVRNTHYMGKKLADFIQFLDKSGVVKAKRLHVIGFSLGAEASGFAGKELRKRKLKVGRITGLDPAYPGYRMNSKDHLSKGDAIFVDVVHTNPGLFGFPKPIGDVDFYPNPGLWKQPGCALDQLFKNNQLNYFVACSHNRAWRLYAESLANPKGFPATLCPDWRSATSRCHFQIDGYMGVNAKPQMKGKMYLATNEKPPFARKGP